MLKLGDYSQEVVPLSLMKEHVIPVQSEEYMYHGQKFEGDNSLLCLILVTTLVGTNNSFPMWMNSVKQ